MSMLAMLRSPYTGLVVNMACAAFHCAVGIGARSWWYVTTGAYYAMLSAARFSVLRMAKKASESAGTEILVRRVTGLLLIGLSFCLIGVNILSALKDRGTRFHEIVMITIAAYTFLKITLAIKGLFMARRSTSQIVRTLRNIAFADSVVAVYSLQRSMLVSFPGMQSAEIQLFNILTGTAAWIIVLFLGINLTGGKYVHMAKSKVAKAHEKITKTVTSGYKKIEKGVVDGYKKIEQGVVAGYTNVEDKFVGAWLTREGETVEETKARLRGENK